MEKNYKYKFLSRYRDTSGKNIIVAQISGSRALFKMPATELIGARKDILYEFSAPDIAAITIIAASEKEPIVIEMHERPFKYLHWLSAFFVVDLLVSNIISTKLIAIGDFSLTAGFIVYPLTFALGDIVTEIYGYKRARQLIWIAMASNLFMVFATQLAILFKPSPFWHSQSEYAAVLGAVPRIVFAFYISYFVGEFLNSYSLAKFKLMTNGKHMWLRLILSTIIGTSADCVIFMTIAFAGILTLPDLLKTIFFAYVCRVGYEVAVLPLICHIIKLIKRIERVDIFDKNTSFSPFSLNIEYTQEENMAGQFQAQES